MPIIVTHTFLKSPQWLGMAAITSYAALLLLLNVLFATTVSLAQQQQLSASASCPNVTIDHNYDPRGNPGMQPCATTDGELEGFYKECMEPDLANWRAPKTPLGLDKVRRFIQMYIQEHDYSPQSFCFIHNNRCASCRGSNVRQCGNGVQMMCRSVCSSCSMLACSSAALTRCLLPSSGGTTPFIRAGTIRSPMSVSAQSITPQSACMHALRVRGRMRHAACVRCIPYQAAAGGGPAVHGAAHRR